MRRLVIISALLGACACSTPDAPRGVAGDGGMPVAMTPSPTATPSPRASVAPSPQPTPLPTPSPGPTEVCGDGIDDVGCICVPGEVQACWTGPRAARHVGACQDGEQRCESGGEFATWSACSGEALPGPEELCGNAVDDDCDGRVDEGCLCVPGETQPCYPGPEAHAGVGACVQGMRTCRVDGVGEPFWSLCEGGVLATPERCGDGIDSDCDGVLDNGCACVLDETRDCYPADPATLGRGICRGGQQACVFSQAEVGAVEWESCRGATIPRREICFDGIDQDCDGQVDENCECTPGESRDCYSGAAGTAGVGSCRVGRQVCTPQDDGGQLWGPCLGEVLPSPDVCGDGLDTDCNGDRDPGCLCIPGDVRACYPGPAPTRGRGECRDGVERCQNTGGVNVAWGACEGASLPGAEVCDDGLDQDCDGHDEECPPVLDVDVAVNGDCIQFCCPPSHPYPVGCNLNFRGGDNRGCVAYNPGANCVYLQEGNVCGAGRVTGNMRCSATPGGALSGANCPINKPRAIYGTRRRDCPD